MKQILVYSSCLNKVRYSEWCYGGCREYAFCMDTKKAFGVTMRRFRMKSDISQEALALEIGMARSYIHELEHGLKEPSVASLFRICRGLGIKPHEFIKKMESRLK